MKKMMIGTSLAIIALAGIGSSVAYGEEVEGNGAKTTGTVVFEENKTPTDPVVPPVTPTDPTDPTGPDKPTGNTEPLRIDLAPNLHFGSFKVGTGSKVATNTRTNSNLQVTDGRGTLAGWQVSIVKTDFKNGSHVLPAVLTLTPGTTKDSKNQPVTLAGNIKKAVVVNSAAQPIFAANQNEGGGTYLQNFDGNKATLGFDSNLAKIGTYTSELTWTLTTAVTTGAA